MNGEPVLRTRSRSSAAATSTGHDPAVKKDGELLEGGSISLQSESHPVEFRKVEILNLVGCMDKKAKNYKAYFEKDDQKSCRY